jgi:hypothetical protein
MPADQLTFLGGGRPGSMRTRQEASCVARGSPTARTIARGATSAISVQPGFASSAQATADFQRESLWLLDIVPTSFRSGCGGAGVSSTIGSSSRQWGRRRHIVARCHDQRQRSVVESGPKLRAGTSRYSKTTRRQPEDDRAARDRQHRHAHARHVAARQGSAGVLGATPRFLRPAAHNSRPISPRVALELPDLG